MSQLASIDRGNAPADTPWFELVRRQVSSLRYGVVQIIVHDGHVTQIEKAERIRLNSVSGAIALPEKRPTSSDSSAA